MNKENLEEFNIEDTTLCGDEHLRGVANGKPLEVDENYEFVSKSILLKIFIFFIFLIFKPLFILFSFVVYGLKIKGLKNLKDIKKQGCVSISNHVMPVDTTLIASVPFWNRRVYFPSLKQNFEIPFIRHLIKLLGAWPIPSTLSGNKNFVNTVNRELKNKKAIHIMPEGALWEYYNKLRPFKNGAFKFAHNNHVPILPVVFTFRKATGFFRLIGRKLLVTMTILPAVKTTEFSGDDREIVEITKQYCYNQMHEYIEKEKSVNGFDLKTAYENYLQRNKND